MKNIYLLGLVFMAALGSSCAAYYASRQEKKDNKLFAKAVANERVFPKIGNLWNANHPIDLTPVIIKGKDSIVYAKQDYTELINAYKIIDSLLEVKCPDVTNRDSLVNAISGQIKKSLKPDTVYRTITIQVKDTSCQHMLIDSKLQLSNLQGKYDQQAKENTTLKAEGRKKSLWIIGISVLAVLTIAGLTYLLFKK